MKVRRLVAFILCFFAGLTASAQFSPIQYGADPPINAALVCTLTSGVCTGTGAGTPPQFSAANCNGVADTSGAWTSFDTFLGTWTASNPAAAAQGVELDIPPTSVCAWTGAVHGLWSTTSPPVKITVVGYGATLTNLSSSSIWFYLGGFGLTSDNAHSARTSAASPGAECVNLLTPSQNTIFSVGTWALEAGFDLQGTLNSGQGFPANPYYFDYVLVSGIDATHNCDGSAGGSVSFITTPLSNTYETTWPNYDPGSGGGMPTLDQGGPATLYQLQSSWNSQIEYRGVTIDMRNIAGQRTTDGRSITYRDVTFASTTCDSPSVIGIIQYIRVDMSGCTQLEVDKIIGQIMIDRGKFYKIDFQSSSTNLLVIKDSTTVSNGLVGSAKRTLISDSTINNLEPGAHSFGRSNEVICTRCNLTQITTGGVTESGTVTSGVWGLNGQSGGPYNSTMSGGTVTIPRTHGAVTWAVPGTNFTFAYGGKESTFVYQVGDVTADMTNTYVTTNCVGSTTICGSGGGLPVASGTLTIQVHPAPKFTCSPCYGGPLITSFSTAPAAAPLYSYSKVVYDRTANVSSTAGPDMWGTVGTLNFTVSSAYAGATNPYTFFPLYQFGYGVIEPGGTTTTYTPAVDLRTSGARQVTSSGVTGGGGADSGLTLPATTTWLTGTTQPNISATTSDWTGTITIEMTTNQGVVNPAQ